MDPDAGRSSPARRQVHEASAHHAGPVYFGIKLIGIAETIYGLTLILFFLPSGIWGSLTGAWRRRPAAAGPSRPAAA